MKGEGKKGRVRGKKAIKILKDLNKILKKHKVISKSVDLLAPLAPEKYRGRAKAVGGVAKQLGYGYTKGGALRLAGQGRRPSRAVKPVRRRVKRVVKRRRKI